MSYSTMIIEEELKNRVRNDYFSRLRELSPEVPVRRIWAAVDSKLGKKPPKGLLYPPHDRGNARKREKNADFATLLRNLRQFGTLFGTLWCLFGKT